MVSSFCAEYGLKSAFLAGRRLALCLIWAVYCRPTDPWGNFMTNYSYPRTLILGAGLVMVIGAASPALAQRHRGDDRDRRPIVVARQAPPVFSSRQIITPRVVASGPFYAPRVYRSVSPVVVVGRPAAPRIISPRASFGAPPLRFYRPYYEFRPRVHVGSGFSIGFPVAYSSGYYYNPYYSSAYGSPYPAYPVYGYPAPGVSYPTYPYPPQAYPQSPYASPYALPAPGSVVVQPGQTNTGGASFEVTPNTAEVLVDGISMGPASQFNRMTAPLGLTPGQHHFEILAPGYRTIAVDADIVAGQVTPFQGTMER
jgi:hypothetical protein